MDSNLKVIEIAEIKNAEIRSMQGINGEMVYSVFDLIKAFGSQKNVRDTWGDITKSHPEVVGKTDNFSKVPLKTDNFQRSSIKNVTTLQTLTNCYYWKFPGQGQRETPVANVRGCMEIAVLIPGKKAAKLRALMVDVFVRYFEADPEIAKDIIGRTESPKDLAGIQIAVETQFEQIMDKYGGSLPLNDLTPAERAVVRPYVVGRQRQIYLTAYEDKKDSLRISVMRKRITKSGAKKALDEYAASLDEDFKAWLANASIEPEPLMEAA
ncbi:MAG: hypothetical protein AAF810_01400 [Cyanobacteria bacterium P01_D01_bin.36]